VTRLVAAIAIAAFGSCAVDRRSTGLACTGQGQCPDGRSCDQGYCVLLGSGSALQDAATDTTPADAVVCPQGCSCDVSTSTCMIVGTGGQPVTCPSGWNCQIDCVGGDACGDITCTMAASCSVSCVGGGACGAITCGPGKCDTMCTGGGACGMIDCSSSCRCDVECLAGSCQQISCPMTPQGQYCTPTGSDGPPCSSSFAGQCHSC